MSKQFDSLNIETSLNSFRDIFSEYFSSDSKWEIRTLEDFYISVDKKDEGVIDSLFIYVKESKNIGYKVIDFEMIFAGSYNLFGNNHRPNQRETIRAIVLEIKNKIEKNSAQMIDSIVPKESMKVDNIQKSKNAFEKDKLPTFIPSLANHPEGFEDHKNNNILNLKYALYNHSSSIQSFFNDLDLISISDNIFSINDDVLNLPPFDEAVYCQIVREMHRFSLAELRDKHEEQSNARSKFGLIAGGLLGILMRNPFAPFFGAQMGSNVGKSVGAKSNKIKEFLPDPNLLFFKDNYSYLSIGRSQTPKTRRIIFAPLKGENGNLYFRIIPAIVTLDYILPMQIFKIGINEYYLRPIGAGIDRHQKNYDAIKIHRKYYHQRIGDGISKDTEERIKVVGPDIEDIHYKLYSYQSDSQDLSYLYFDYIKQPGHVY